ncbi:MAG TPA: hypothetical protein VII70_03890 [Steroidobacteraceae bacterium]
MATRNRRNGLGLAALMGTAVLLTGCSHLSGRWPFGHQTPAAPTSVLELGEVAGNGNRADFPQYWKRNTLLIDLHDASGEGSLILTPRSGTQWPVRLAFRVTPGAIGVLEVRGEERVVMPVVQEGRQPVDLELAPGVYTLTTVHITVRWGAR